MSERLTCVQHEVCQHALVRCLFLAVCRVEERYIKVWMVPYAEEDSVCLKCEMAELTQQFDMLRTQ